MSEPGNKQAAGTPGSVIAAEASAAPVSRQTWHRTYYLLAAFDVLTVAVSLYIVAHLIGTYEEAVRVNQEWTVRMSGYERLDELAAAVNTPGNDVFESRDPEAESERFDASLRVWGKHLALLQEDVRANVAPTVAAPLQEGLQVVAFAMTGMVDDARLVFSHMKEHHPDLAGMRMAAMDRAYTKVLEAVDRVRQQATEIQRKHLREQSAAAGALGTYQYGIAIAILLMIVGATAYGRKLARRAESDAQQREWNLERLAAANEALGQSEAELSRLHEAAKAHAAQWEALFGMSRLLNQSLQLDGVFKAFAQAVKAYVPYDRLGVIVPQENTLVVAYAVADPPLQAFAGLSWSMTQQTGIEWILTHKEPRLVRDLTTEAQFEDDRYMAQEGVRTILELPLLVGGEAKGVFYLDSRTPAAYSERDIERLFPLADQVAMVLEHGRLYDSVRRQADMLRQEIEERARAEEQLRTLTARLESVREDERSRMAKEIHEELGQLLFALKIDLSWLHARLPQEPAALQEKSHAIKQSVDETIRWVRRVASELRPRVLDDLGLVAAIEWQAQEFQARTGIQVLLTIQQPESALDWERSTAVFRIVQEALSNVARHAQGSRVHIALRADAERLTLEVIDNGKGITQHALADRNSIGLLSMRERAFLLGGAVTITGRPGQGTTVTVTMPLEGSGGRTPGLT
ncbi:MAG: GAF domain-containing sensor histidine kinase [Candidatus Methylomirabilis sp.]|nr:GAF domain-containing sensor histidine kinase [Candidatus Methylomirabilis sp.]